MNPSGIYDTGLITAMLIIVAGIVLMLVWAFWIAFAERGATHRQEATGESAAEALRQRFAQGEISDEEFAETLRVLRESR